MLELETENEDYAPVNNWFWGSSKLLPPVGEKFHFQSIDGELLKFFCLGFHFAYCAIKLTRGMYILTWFDKLSVSCVNVKANSNFYTTERMTYIHCSISNCLLKRSCPYCSVALNHCATITKTSKVGPTTHPIYLVFANNINRC